MGQVIAFPGHNRAGAALAADPVTADPMQTQVAAPANSAGPSVGRAVTDADGYAMVGSFDDLAAIMAGMVYRPDRLLARIRRFVTGDPAGDPPIGSAPAAAVRETASGNGRC